MGVDRIWVRYECSLHCLFKTAFQVMNTFTFQEGIFWMLFQNSPVYTSGQVYISVYFPQNIFENRQTSTKTYRMVPGKRKISQN